MLCRNCLSFLYIKYSFGLRKCVVRNLTVKRKYPSVPGEELNVPVFDYGIGSSQDRRVYVWGAVRHGALGIHTRLHKKKAPPECYQRPSCHSFSFMRKIKDVACGYGFTAFAVKSDDKLKLFGCGLNTDSQIGYHAPRRDHPLGLVLAPAPIEIPLKSDKTKISKIAAGRAHLVALSDNEGVFTLGNNSYGQCGRRIIENEKYEGSQVVNVIHSLNGEKVVDVCCGQDHTLFLTDLGKVWSCGLGADGQTGLEHYNTEWEPKQVKGDIKNEHIIKVTGVGDSVLALNDNGEVFGWGNSEYTQILQENNVMQYNTAVNIPKLQPIGRIVDVACGGSSCIVVNEEGRVFVWGFGLLGSGPEVMRCTEPRELPLTLFGRNQFEKSVKVVKVISGLYHLGAITNNGHLYMWGHNKGGCLGLGHRQDQYFPMKVAVGAYVIKVSAGVDHTVALCKPFA